jgi:16S rRNA (uracil1498-N3)-methyltransferase
MKLHRFYTESSLQVNKTLSLGKQESHHICQVLKLKSGQVIHLFNGNNIDYRAEIISSNRKTTSVIILEAKPGIPPSNIHTTLYLSISKGDRMDIAIQKSVELGINRIIPIISDRTVVKLDSHRTEKRMSHWIQIIISACEQSGRSEIPTLMPITTLKNISPVCTSRYLLTPDTSEKLTQQSISNNIGFIVGPEGGLTEDEIQHCQQLDFKAVSLGPIVLRTETAPLAALAVLQSLKGNFT